MLSNVRAIAFDLDNTLWDVEPVLARAETRLFAWLQHHCPRITAQLSPEDMRRAREQLARREPHMAHDFTYLRTAALAGHARDHGYACIRLDAYTGNPRAMALYERRGYRQIGQARFPRRFHQPRQRPPSTREAG